MFVLLLAVLALLFWKSLIPGYTVFSNDGPLGTLMSQSHRLPERWTGGWQDLNTVGYQEGNALPSVTYLILFILGPVGFSKFYAPVCLLVLGMGAWCFFRQLGFAPLVCLLGGLATALNSAFFSAACWGVAAHPLTIGLIFLALAALVDNSSRRRWIRVALGGFAVGMAVMEGADIGAIFSLFVAAFVMYQAWMAAGPRVKSLATGVSRVSLVALCAAFLASQALVVLTSTVIQGVAGTGQDTQTKEQRWDWATQWSLPKREALGFLVPGVFGYRMDSPEGGNYWGAVGRDPNWDRYFASDRKGPPPAGTMRFSGGGVYAGVLVVLVACWALLQSFRKEDSVYGLGQKRWIWFWFGVAVLSLLLSFGRFAPFYQFLYALPYFSTIRNPAKFTHVVSWAMVVLFAYGADGIWRRYLAASGTAAAESFGQWWRKAQGFERTWSRGCLAALGAAFVGWLAFALNRETFEKYLQEVQFDAGMAKAIAGFSLTQVAIALLFFAVALGLVLLVMSGKFRGKSATLAGALLGLFLVVDLGRANQPWVIFWDYSEKYATNPIIEKLRERPFEYRVAGLPRWFPQVLSLPPQVAELEQYFRQLYGIEWTQHHFLYYDIQSLDIVQMSRMPADLEAFENTFQPRTAADLSTLVARRWQLTNTRYLLGTVAFLDALNQLVDPAQHRFRIAERFNIVPKPEVPRPSRLEELTAAPATNGNFALFEFTGALPRAKLYANWQVTTNDQAALAQLANPAFDPEKAVLVAGNVPAADPAASTNPSPGTVQFTSYAPKDIRLKAEVKAPSVLLLNDHFDANWKVFVDGKQEPLLRCNYLMRGVYLTPGTREVRFSFEPPIGALYVSLTAVIIAIALCAFLAVFRDSTEAEPQSPAPSKKPEGMGKR
jgi:hypothetical protein